MAKTVKQRILEEIGDMHSSFVEAQIDSISHGGVSGEGSVDLPDGFFKTLLIAGSTSTIDHYDTLEQAMNSKTYDDEVMFLVAKDNVTEEPEPGDRVTVDIDLYYKDYDETTGTFISEPKLAISRSITVTVTTSPAIG